jgi:hypothetical protein
MTGAPGAAQVIDVLRWIRRVRPSRNGRARGLLRSGSFLLLAAAASSVPVGAQEFSAATHAEPPPGELAAPIRAGLAAGGARVALDANTLEFWWAAAMPADATSAGTGRWSGVAQGTLVGAVRIASPFREIRGKAIRPGVYTLRYGVQPANGDHLGVSPFRDFLLLCPAGGDTSPGPLGYEAVARLSATSIGGAHPGTLSLDPPETTAGLLTTHTTELGHRALVFEVPLAGGGTLRFGLVLVGKVEA